MIVSRAARHAALLGITMRSARRYGTNASRALGWPSLGWPSGVAATGCALPAASMVTASSVHAERTMMVAEQQCRGGDHDLMRCASMTHLQPRTSSPGLVPHESCRLAF